MISATILLVILGLIVTVLWICLPFLVMGTNRRLDQLIREIRALNATVSGRSPGR